MSLDMCTLLPASFPNICSTKVLFFRGTVINIASSYYKVQQFAYLIVYQMKFLAIELPIEHCPR